MFTAAQGGPVEHKTFYRRVFRRTIEGRDATQRSPAVPALWPEGHRLHGLRWHDLRHTAVALAIATGTDAKAISARFGHSSIAITFDRYGHLMPGTDDALAAGLNLAFRPGEVVPLSEAPSHRAS